ncbi:NADPH-dependent F420 reductase [Asanoa sp. WMMD1127]|uniref:NADPH-dependent F420 reductase n=1 Tax=Asanoa sp. WMMD1127 TaxID=3016107 RepID=UPI0024168B72|nr:NADPH-dependent F420 reductase [Asanoa sp. WMMD1127]MDG4822009.1 NADPH-dependent F420 reductase [Asanoa sp. WMMD1127]
MRIGIVGSGKVGGTLTRRFRELGYDVSVANRRGPESLRPLADQTGATAATVADAAKDADLVVLAIPVRAVEDLPKQAFDGKIVIDANNYYAERDGEIEPIADRAVTSSRWIADHLPDSRVVKAFNNISASHLGRNGKPYGENGRIALPIAGDDTAAKQVVEGLVDELGFDPVDAGTLDASWRQQPGTPVYLTDLDQPALRRTLKV